MLILAGVSISAIVGEDGVITKAQSATYTQSRVVLEEYINQYYVEHYDDFEDVENKAVALKNYSKSASWFYQGAPLGYVVDSDGSSHYFINVNGLPDELKSSIKGGNAKGKETLTYQDYAKMEDVYGITSDLRVYYCENGKDTLVGVELADLDKADSTVEIFEAGSAMAKLITGSDDKKLTLEDLKSIKTLTIDSTSGITNLKDLYALVSLQELTLDGLTLNSLEGIENATQLNYVFFKSSVVSDYSSLSKIRNLKYLYMTGTANSEVEKMCNGIKNAELRNLQYFGIYDSPSLTDISGLENLSTTTKQAVKYLYLYNNKISSISALSEYKNVIELRVYSNKITTLSGIENMSNLAILKASSCLLGKYEIYDYSLENFGKNETSDSLSVLKNLKKLKDIDISNNYELKWCSYLKDLTLLNILNVRQNTNMVIEDVALLKDVYYRCNDYSRNTFDSKYKYLFNTSDTIDYKGYKKNLSNNDAEILALYENTNVKYLRLDGNTNLGDNIENTTYNLSDILSTCTNIVVLSLRGITQIDNIDFVKNMPNLKVLDLWDCSNINDISVLEELANETSSTFKLSTLRVNNSSISLANLPKIVSGLSGTQYPTMFGSEAFESFGLCASAEVYQSLKDCTDLENLYIYYRSSLAHTKVDLSKCTKLKTVWVSHCDLNFIFPSSITTLRLSHYSSQVVSKLDNCNQLTDIILNEVYNIYPIAEWIQEIGKCSNVKNISINTYQFSPEIDFSYLKDCNQLKTLKLYSYSSGVKKGNVKLSGLEELNSLENLYFSDMGIASFSFKLPPNLVSLTIRNAGINNIDNVKLLVKLQELNLNNNNISNLKALENLIALKTVYLEQNNIFDISTDIDENNNKFNYNNLDILANLNRNGVLRNLYLEGNNGITNWNALSSITNWTGKSGW